MSTNGAPAVSSSLRSRYKGVETASFAGLAILASVWAFFSTERLVFGAKTGWGELNWVALSDYDEARELLAKKKWPEAAIILRSVVNKDPDYVPAAIQLAESLFYSNRREEGLSIL